MQPVLLLLHHMSLLLRHSCPTLQFILLRVPGCGNRPWRRRGEGVCLVNWGWELKAGHGWDRDGTREAAPLWWAQVLPGQSRLERTLGLTWRSHIGNHQAWAARLGADSWSGALALVLGRPSPCKGEAVCQRCWPWARKGKCSLLG